MAGTARIVLGILLILVGLLTLIFLVGVLPLLLGLLLLFWGVDARRRERSAQALISVQRQRVTPASGTLSPASPEVSHPQAGLAGVSHLLGQGPVAPCPRCSGETTYVAPERKNYCARCRQYV